MEYHVRRIDPKSAALTFFGVGAIFGCLVAVLSFLAQLNSDKGPNLEGIGVVLFQTTLAWTLAGLTATLAYNYISARLGGLKVTLADCEEEKPEERTKEPS